jgi:hypothetical protein
MSNDLYFIPLISKAVSQSSPRVALKKAFTEIIMIGKLPEYRRGFMQFRRFMAKVFAMQENEAPWLMGIWDGHFAETVVQVIIIADGAEIASFPLRQSHLFRATAGVVPGLYTIKLSTGRILWMGELTRSDVHWYEAFPGGDLKLAADTGDQKPLPTKEITVLHGEIIIRIFPGFEGGTIEVMRSTCRE